MIDQKTGDLFWTLYILEYILWFLNRGEWEEGDFIFKFELNFTFQDFRVV